MLRRLYERTLTLARHPQALLWLGAVAFVESSVFPVPPDALIVPMVLAERARAWRIAAVATVASVAGGMFGYAIGYGLFETVGRPILEFYGALVQFEEFQRLYWEWGVWIVVGAGLTPFPYKVVTIASGAVALDPMVFLLASLASRGLRFYAEAALLWYAGPPVRRFVENNLQVVATLFFFLLVGGFIAAGYVM